MLSGTKIAVNNEKADDKLGKENIILIPWTLLFRSQSLPSFPSLVDSVPYGTDSLFLFVSN